MISERQLNFLVNPNLNKKLPVFVNIATLGLNFGVQGMQFTATSTTSENQTLSTSSYIHSISCNNDNQDIVSMGFNAARIARDIINNTFEVITIEAIAIMQAVEALKYDKKLSPYNKNIFSLIKANFKPITFDRATYKEQIVLKDYLQNNKPGLFKEFIKSPNL
jgi:histidine ammonia-lyase